MEHKDYKCSKCDRSLSTPAAKAVHEKHCDGTGSKLDKRKESANWKCPKCNMHVHSQRERHVEVCDGLGPGAHRRGSRGRSWAKGTKLSEEHKKKISESRRGKPYRPKSPEIEAARREKISRAMKKNPKAGGYRRGSGRCRGSWYDSPYAGRVYLDSSYEVRLAKQLDKSGISWVKNTQKFPYTDESGKNRKYTPDFQLPEHDLWVETKGFKTERDVCKWRDFPFRMMVIYESDLKAIEEGADLFEAYRHEREPEEE